ncbi:glycosyltransferase family protein [Desulfonatronum thiodismutans]|uniref:glycosyltransferase family protein n=1 Tax=Desulfonatronum thiodismutans TaxID=159290 RepID=UPI001F33D5AF|nr:glycosyltransferase [Desulfonatronum thiodismutans]
MRETVTNLLKQEDALMLNSRNVYKVGFGPKTGANSFAQSGVKVAAALDRFPEFKSGFFSWEPFDLDELMNFDVLIFIKYIPDMNMLKALKVRGKVLILDYQDTFLYPSVYEKNVVRRILKWLYYCKTESYLSRAYAMLDGCMICTPLLRNVVIRAGMKPLELPRQIYNDENENVYKPFPMKTEGVVLYWTGVSLNQKQNEPIVPVLKRMHECHGCRILYDTDQIGEYNWIEYRMFDNKTWAKDILDADVAFRWRDTSNLQEFKDPNKVQGYMAAGLPVVIHPTASERLIVEDGKTGFFANSVAEFEYILLRLIQNPQLRHEVGMAAHAAVWKHSSLKIHVECLREHLLTLLGAP